ncbi:hypothetical protein R1sor_005875 [Riccia sorocarpa]|uniref:Uncharacterized protein n=1 Tax=Riccia sorocarpa TaxID=122646 RepID=A0ABD3HSC1_9MARC
MREGHPEELPELVVTFNADVADSTPGKFTPCQHQVLFYIDPEFAEDPKMDNISSLILSHTFFKAEEDEDEEENAASG